MNNTVAQIIFFLKIFKINRFQTKKKNYYYRLIKKLLRGF